MKKISAILLVITMLAAAACKESKTETTKENATETKLSPEAQHDLQLYRRALERGDAYTAIAALNSYLMYDSSKREYKDTLLQMYLQTQQIMASYKVSEELLRVDPNDTAVLEINVSSAFEMGMMDKAIGNTQKLLAIYPNNLKLKLQYAQALIQTGKHQEGLAELEAIVANPAAKNDKVPYTAFEGGQPVQKEIKINLAAVMVIGQYYTQMGNFDKAESYFRQALQIDSRFKEAAQAILGLKQLKNRQ